MITALDLLRPRFWVFLSMFPSFREWVAITYLGPDAKAGYAPNDEPSDNGEAGDRGRGVDLLASKALVVDKRRSGHHAEAAQMPIADAK